MQRSLLDRAMDLGELSSAGELFVAMTATRGGQIDEARAAAVRLHMTTSMTLGEIAAQLGRSTSTVHDWLRSARRDLRAVLNSPRIEAADIVVGSRRDELLDGRRDPRTENRDHDPRESVPAA